MILLVLLLASGLWGIPQATAEEQSRLWYTSVLDDGGALKASMLERGVATEEAVSLGALVMDAWSIAIRRGVKVEVPAERQTAFSMQLFELFLQRHDLSGTPDTTLTWQQFGEIGRLHSGFEPFTQADAEKALELSHELTHEQSQPQLAGTATTQPLPPAPTTSASTVVTPTTPVVVPPAEATKVVVAPRATSPARKLLPVMQGDELVDVMNLGQPVLPSQSVMEQFLEDKAVAEQEAEKAKAKEEATQPVEPYISIWGSEPTTKRVRESTSTRYVGRRQSQRPAQQQRSMRSHTEAFLRSYFHDIPVMVEIARCESGFRNVQSGLQQPYGRERSFGFFQIHEPDWHQQAVSLGLTEYQTDAMHNVLMARHIYNTQGLSAWRASKHCWGRYLSRS
jgi:hypothetical protein